MTVRLSAVSALDPVTRQAACAGLAAARPVASLLEYGIDPSGRLHRRSSRFGHNTGHQLVAGDPDEMDQVVTADLIRCLAGVPTSAGSGEIVIGLPPAVSLHVVLDAVATVTATEAGAGALQVAELVTTVSLAHLDDLLWSPRTLGHAGYRLTDPELEAGAFCVGELLTCSVVAVHVAGDSSAEVRQAERLGADLVRHIAPHADLRVLDGSLPLWLSAVPLGARSRRGEHDDAELERRVTPGLVTATAATTEFVRTHIARVERPLHPQRLAEALETVAAGCVWTRGRLWIASVPDRRVAWAGVGPNIGFEDAGTWYADEPARADDPRPAAMETDARLAWHPVHGDRGTVLAFTGDEVEPDEIDAQLHQCALDDAEFARGPSGWCSLLDPLRLNDELSADLAH